jgi:hypothetical protein
MMLAIRACLLLVFDHLHPLRVAVPMPYPAPNLQALIDKLTPNSLARKLVAAFETSENIETVRQKLLEIVEEEVRRKKE